MKTLCLYVSLKILSIILLIKDIIKNKFPGTSPCPCPGTSSDPGTGLCLGSGTGSHPGTCSNPGTGPCPDPGTDSNPGTSP